jgi:hypothetical protein
MQLARVTTSYRFNFLVTSIEIRIMYIHRYRFNYYEILPLFDVTHFEMKEPGAKDL